MLEGLDVAAWGLEDAADPESRHWLRPDELVAILWAALGDTRRTVEELRRAAQAETGGSSA